MTTTAELEQQLAEVQARIAELRLKFDVNKAEFLQAQREFFAAGNAEIANPNNTALQQAKIEAQAKFESVAARIKPDTDALNAALANERSLQQEITTTAPTKAREKQTEETTIDPKTEPVGNQDVQSLISRREQLAIEARAAIAAGNTALADRLLDQIIALDEQILALDPTYRPGPLPVDGGSGGGTPDNNTDNDNSFIRPPQESAFATTAPDWRFRMSLSPYADYLYCAHNPGILKPLVNTNGVIFPYTPSIQVSYTAAYTPLELTHSNYKLYNYRSSSVENITITGDFTAQDNVEANYLLAVIHFFKSVTKMFYGQDNNPSRGVPPPLVYLQGYGQYQFDMHPVVITNFTLNLPQDVDYISAYPNNNGLAIGAKNLEAYTDKAQSVLNQTQRMRTLGSKIQPGGLPPPPVFLSTGNINEETRVPTKIQIQITCLPIVTRNAISNKFSLAEYATGKLMKGSTNPGQGGGIW